MAAREHGQSVRHVTAPGIIKKLVEAQDARALSRLVARSDRYDVLLVVELG